MNTPDVNLQSWLLVVGVGGSVSAAYSLEEAAELAGVHPEMLRHYCRLGLFGDVLAQPDVELVFDDDALYELRRFEHYRQKRGVDRQTLRLLCGLWREVDRLQAELRSVRGR